MLAIVKYLILFILSVGGIAFFSGFESSFLAINKVKLRHKADKKVHGADFLEGLYDNRDNFLGYTLAGMTLFFVLAFVAVVHLAFLSFPGNGLSMYRLLVMALSIPVVVIFGELLPRTWGRDNSDKAIFFFVKPVMVTYAFLYVPVVIFTSSIMRFFMWVLGSDSSGLGLQSSKEELKLLVRLGEKSGIVDDEERKLIESIFTFKGKTVKECSCPRKDVKALPVDSTIRDMARMSMDTGFSRIPVYKDTKDNFVGVVHISSVLNSVGNLQRSVKGVMHPILSIGTETSLKKALQAFQKQRSHMAVVVSNDGSTQGIVTLEDILEEVVGEIGDEFDTVDSMKK